MNVFVHLSSENMMKGLTAFEAKRESKKFVMLMKIYMISKALFRIFLVNRCESYFLVSVGGWGDINVQIDKRNASIVRKMSAK